MWDIKTKRELVKIAHAMSQNYQLVRHLSGFYVPTDYQSGRPNAGGDISEMVWLLWDHEKLNDVTKVDHDVMFSSESDFANFQYMLSQACLKASQDTDSLMLKTEDGLRILDPTGTLREPDGIFRPNYIPHLLNTDPVLKAELFDILVTWVGSDEDAHSLLYHLSTILSPGWSAEKYILLLGKGRNGKGVLLKMLHGLFGNQNTSHVTRTKIAAGTSTCIQVNNKLVNIVYDGEKAYIKDSANEKTLIVGEPIYVHKLYVSEDVRVQTNALFLEGLNNEPKTVDKSSALQKRLVRFRFDQTYEIDKSFQRRMLRTDMLGALLSLLLDHFVTEDEVALKLLPTVATKELQVEQVILNSPLHQFLLYLVEQDHTMLAKLTAGGIHLKTLVGPFQAWQISEVNGTYNEVEIVRMIKDAFEWKWGNHGSGSARTQVQILKLPKQETKDLLDNLKEREIDDTSTVVEDGQLPPGRINGAALPAGPVGTEGSSTGTTVAGRED